MNNQPKLMLSDEELLLVNNSNWILTKRAIMNKVIDLLGVVHESQKKLMEQPGNGLPAAVTASTAKIAKGENYLQLPYVILDYPRCFAQPDIFAVRTMFWWGNFFSCTLLLSGVYQQEFQKRILKNMPSVQVELYICVHESPWHHYFDHDNYVPVKAISLPELEKLIYYKQFIKLAVKHPLQAWGSLPDLLHKSFLQLTGLLMD